MPKKDDKKKSKKGSVLEGDLKKEGIVAEENAFLEGEEHKETPEQLGEEMDLGEVDEDVYTEEGREKALEDDDISAEEEGFMEGAAGKGKQSPTHKH